MNRVASITLEVLEREGRSQSALARAITDAATPSGYRVSRQAVNNWTTGRNKPNTLLLAGLTINQNAPAWLREWAFSCLEAVREGKTLTDSAPTVTLQ